MEKTEASHKILLSEKYDQWKIVLLEFIYILALVNDICSNTTYIKTWKNKSINRVRLKSEHICKSKLAKNITHWECFGTSSQTYNM